jgi:hypothetical protein
MKNTSKIDCMDAGEFEGCTKKIAQNLGKDSIRFFTTIHNMARFFEDSDAVLKKSPASLQEFETTVQKITDFLGQKDSARFFASVYNALPKKTALYSAVMVRVFELMR